MALLRELLTPEALRDVVRTGRSTGLPGLDRLTRGLVPGALWVLLAPAGAGRTVLMCQIARAAAGDGADTALVLGRDGPDVGVVNLLAAESRVPALVLRSGDAAPHEQPRLASAVEHLSQLDLRVLTTSDPDWPFSGSTQVASADVWFRGQHTPLRQVADVLLLDDLDGVTDAPITGAVAALRRWSRSTGQTTIVSLPHDGLLDDRVLSPSLRRDADVVLLLDRPDLHDPGCEQSGEAALHVIAHRDGPTTVLSLVFDGSRRRFAEPRRPVAHPLRPPGADVEQP